MTSNTEFQSHLSKKSSLVLGGEIAFREQMGGGTVSGLFRHQISADGWFTVSFNCTDFKVVMIFGLQFLFKRTMCINNILMSFCYAGNYQRMQLVPLVSLFHWLMGQ